MTTGVTITRHDFHEFSRAATALYRRGANAEGHALSVMATRIGQVVPVAVYDRVADIYRAWLVRDEPKAS